MNLKLSCPSEIKQVVLGPEIKIEHVIAVARYKAEISFSDDFIKRVTHARKIVEELAGGETPIYGINTGLGENWKRKISKEDREIVQRNNLLSHACSLGEPCSKDQVRAMMFVMIQHLGMGHSGIRLETLEVLKALLNKDIIPYVPRHGSVGYLCLEAHIGLVLIGEGKAYVDGKLYPAKEALELKGLEATVISSKEGLSLTSGTTSVTAFTALGLYDALILAQTADLVGAMSLEVLKGTVMAMDERLMAQRPHEDQANTAYNIRTILEDSEIIKHYENHRVQDALSLRSMPQLHGAAKKVLKDALVTLEIELNSSVDNPLVFDEDGVGFALMGCNADGSYLGIAADACVIAVANLMKMSERRLDRLVNPLINELPAFLNSNPGLNNGLMIPQYTAAGIMGQIKILTHPASVDNFVTCANQEDYVSMGYNCAKKLVEVTDLAKYILSTELFNACQGQDFYTDIKPASATKHVRDKVREVAPFVHDDSNMSPYIEAIAVQIKERVIMKTLEEVTNQLKF
ncbi:aromatic amino acid lyase [Acidaminobacter sp. JC074]|uniref:HAL/PAL/TAL family ammonia-lyase n=1 Tax=Acidaminobacter sp. JC074 TaxID=2530199 RepID=UPI001F10BAE2|nr:aromatic amino acid ammonia-lyase [Acidaminobacter sp. JC074]MCH4887829.1 aromatic amino acid lyase [Acidaminobacter sp. JC074]